MRTNNVACRAAGLVGGFALAAVCQAGPSATITSLVLEGDSVPGVGLVTSINNIAVNNSGQWLVEVDTDNADTDIDSALLRDGVLDWREGDAVPAPSGATLNTFDSVTLSNTGHSGYNFFLSGTAGGTSDDSGVYDFFFPGSQPFDGTVLTVQESDEAPGLTPGTPFIGYFDVKINDAGQLWVVASVDDPNIASTVDRALYVMTSDTDNGGVASYVLVAAEGDVLPDQVEAAADFGTGPHQSAFNDNGDALFFVDLAGDTSVDGCLYTFDYDALDRLLYVQEGDPSPVLGRNWSSLSSPELDINNNGDIVHSGSLDGDSATNLLIAKNGVKFRQEGDPVPGLLGPVFSLTSFGSGPIEISDSGDVVWYGDWDDADTDIDTGLFLNDTLLVQEGVTQIDGVTVDTLRGVEDGYHMSSNGQYIIFEAILLDGTEGAFLIELAPACPWDCGDSDGAITVVDLLALLGQWGLTGGSCDFNGTGVGVVELLKLLGQWGSCR